MKALVVVKGLVALGIGLAAFLAMRALLDQSGLFPQDLDVAASLVFAAVVVVVAGVAFR